MFLTLDAGFVLVQSGLKTSLHSMGSPRVNCSVLN
jgi:hypothetical protein